MNARWIWSAMAVAMLGTGWACVDLAQEGTGGSAPALSQDEAKPAKQWEELDYTCEGGAKLKVSLHDDAAKVRFQDHTYLMKQTMAADGNRYSDGKVVWWGKGNGGFLQEDNPDGNGKMIVKDCKLNKP